MSFDCYFIIYFFSFIDRGEFGEVFQGTATDILGVGTGPTPVAVKVHTHITMQYCKN